MSVFQDKESGRAIDARGRLGTTVRRELPGDVSVKDATGRSYVDDVSDLFCHWYESPFPEPYVGEHSF